ncbi:nuclear factor 7, brain-like isoform X2 [Conger conger]|uniref:nuclear factor 7, brain-like isoform X2 n=1 Tax=Conger conger TaxID=82655 RepID=UPI002A5993C2|nr:nuclear factor 7, brain-like isoform X2 [Conger conger]
MATEASALDELQSELTCPVCLELFREPVILECGHHFCRQCITQCWSAKPEENPTCPQCRKTCAQKLRPNSLLCNVVDSVRRARAMDAEPTAPRERTQRPPVSGGSSELAPEPDQCEEHEEKLKLFCEDDQVAICLVCGMSRDHKTHSVIPINEAFENYKERLSAALQRVELQIEEASSSQTLTNQKMMEIKEHAGTLEDQMGREFAQLRLFLQREEEQARATLRGRKEERLQQLDETLTHTTQHISTLHTTALQLQHKLDQDDNPAQLRGIKNFISDAETLFQRPLEVSMDLQAGEFLGPLQYRLWRKMSSILNPGPAAVTLDPDTAYPRLVVSPCGTSVRVGEIQRNLPDNPERFTLYNIVLGSQAFSSGRHYWEVEVGDKTAWGLGVAAAWVNRKEEVSLCPEDGFWTVGLRSGGEYEACTSAGSALSLGSRPRRVGLFLDLSAGLLSFYDSADMSHIFTFSHIPPQPLYPYFNPWPIISGQNTEPLRVVAPRP